MSDTTQDGALAPKADEAGDGGANITQQPGQDTLREGDRTQRKSQQRQADGDFPIMT